MAVKAVLFDEKGKAIGEVTGDFVQINGLMYKVSPFGVMGDVASGSFGRLIPDAIPEYFGDIVNSMIKKAVEEKFGEKKANEIRMRTSYIIASGGRKSNG